MKSTRTHLRRIEITAFALLVFIVMLYFFTAIHPISFLDADDWLYASYSRYPLPIWGAWNPSRVLPEVLQPFVSTLSAHVLMPIAGGYTEGISLGTEIVVSVGIAVYVTVFQELLVRRAGLSRTVSAMLALMFFVFHFLMFRSAETGNRHLFYAIDLTCYYFYIIPALLNACLVIWLLIDDVLEQFWSKDRVIVKGIFALAVYLAVFSNLFGSVILVSFLGALVVFSLVRDVKARSFRVRSFLSEHSARLVIVALWLVANIFELSGGRAGSAPDTSFLMAFAQAFENLISNALLVNHWFALLYAVTIIAGVTALMKSRSIQPKDSKRLSVDCPLSSDLPVICASALITALYLLIVCAKVDPTYTARFDAIFGLAFFALLVFFCEAAFLVRRYERIALALPIVLFVVTFLVNTPGQTFAATNVCGFPDGVCQRINHDVVGQALDAAERGEQSAEVYVPDFHRAENFPLPEYGGPRVGYALYMSGLTDYELQTSFVIDPGKNDELSVP